MPEIHEIWKNHLMEPLLARRRKRLLAFLPELNACSHNNYLALYDSLTRKPEQFFAVHIYRSYLTWLESRHLAQGPDLVSHFEDNNNNLNQSILFLSEINRYDWHDSYDTIDEYETIRFIDQKVHPTYLRLLEAVYHPFVHLLAHFSRLDRGKQTEGLDLFNSVQELQFTGFNELAFVYKNTVRNGIAHGGITYLHQKIRYRDKKGNEEKLGDRQVIDLCDDLLDTCNAMFLALAVFLFCHIRKKWGTVIGK